MNRNTDFAAKETFFDNNGEVFSERFTVTDFRYSANKITIGYKKNKARVYLGLYTTILSPYFDETTRFNVPFVGASFDIGKL